MTAPDVRSPYCTDGMPLITSIDSMLSVEMERTSTPEFGTEPALNVDVPAIVVEVPFMAELMPSMLALLDTGEPSMIMAVPRLFMSLPAAVRRLRLCALDRLGFEMLTPGSNCMTSPSELVRAWSMAWRDIVDAVDSPALLL